ncbi:MAG: hypothetical protein ACYC2Z_08895, partial [Candidatus Nanopelagicales bacterium]
AAAGFPQLTPVSVLERGWTSGSRTTVGNLGDIVARRLAAQRLFDVARPAMLDVPSSGHGEAGTPGTAGSPPGQAADRVIAPGRLPYIMARTERAMVTVRGQSLSS